MRIPVLRIADGNEADDAIGTLALRAHEQGIDATIVTADRDFFQLVRPGVTVMFNRKGISDIVRYDEDGRRPSASGSRPTQYLDYVALKGDTCDNIPGVPGVGEKTASKLVNEFGSVEELVANTDMLKGKQRENVEASAGRLSLNKELARIDTDLELPVGPEDCVMGEWDMDEVRRLFTSLEFRSLLDRLQEVGTRQAEGRGRRARPARGGGGRAAGDLRRAARRWACSSTPTTTPCAASPLSAGGAQAAYASARAASIRWVVLADAGAPKWAHDAKELEASALRSGGSIDGVAFDTMLAGYLLDPAAGRLSAAGALRDLPRRRRAGAVEESRRGGAAVRRRAVAARRRRGRRRRAARARDGGADRARGCASCSTTSSCRSRRCSRGWRPAGSASTSTTSRRWASRSATAWPRCKADVYRTPGEEFNLNSPPQLRVILYEKLGLSPGKKTPKGAAVHRRERAGEAARPAPDRRRPPAVARARQAELDLPRGAAAASSIRATGACTRRSARRSPRPGGCPRRTRTCRTSRSAPSSGARSGGVRARRAGSGAARAPTTRRSSCGSWRTCRATRGCARRSRPATTSIRRPPRGCSACPLDQVDPALRSRAKMVNYGLAYGMNAWGLASASTSRPTRRRRSWTRTSRAFPTIREYLDRQVGRATVDGYTETLLGRRRYIPELQAANPRVRDLGRRMALNAPIQGSASDVFKLAMIRVDLALRERPDLECHMLLTVHDELVFEVAADQRRGGRARSSRSAWSRPSTSRCRSAPTSAGAPTGPRPRRPGTEPVAV